MLGRLRFAVAKAATPGLAEQLGVQAEAARMPADRLEALQLAKLNRLLDHFRKVDFYARLLAGHGAPAGPLASLEQIRLLPVVTKEFIRANLAAIAASPTAGRRAGTSGSTGYNFAFYDAREAAGARMAAVLLACEMVGLDYWRDRRFVLWHVSENEQRRWPRIKGTFRRRLLCTRLVRAYGMDEDRACRFLEGIRRFRPKAIIAFPSYLFLLAQAGRRRGIVPYQPKLLLCSGEKLLPQYRELAEGYFQAPLYDRYGSSEFRLIAQQCLQGGCQHVPPTRLFAETDENGEILLTDLDNTATPFIRYRIGDAGVVRQSQCPCGRTGQVIDEVFGRTYDIITTPSGRLLPGQLWSSILRQTPGIEQYQLVQPAADKLQMRIVVNERYRPAEAELIRQHVRSVVGDEIELSFLKVARIEPGPSGKRRFVIREDGGQGRGEGGPDGG